MGLQMMRGDTKAISQGGRPTGYYTFYEKDTDYPISKATKRNKKSVIQNPPL